MGPVERAQQIHHALLSLYRDGLPLETGLRPIAGAGCRVGVVVRDASAQLIAANLRERDGVADAVATGAPAAQVHITVAPWLARAALETLLRRQPLARTTPAPSRVPREVITAAQLAHSRAHRLLRRAERVGAAFSVVGCDSALDPYAAGLFAQLADQPRLLGPRRLTDSARRGRAPARADNGDRRLVGAPERRRGLLGTTRSPPGTGVAARAGRRTTYSRRTGARQVLTTRDTR